MKELIVGLVVLALFVVFGFVMFLYPLVLLALIILLFAYFIGCGIFGTLGDGDNSW